MATHETTTIRVSVKTRDRLRRLAARREETAIDTISKLVETADEADLLTCAALDFERMPDDHVRLYRSEFGDIGEFDSEPPAW